MRTYLQVTQNMKLRKGGKHSDACLPRYLVVTAFGKGLVNPPKDSRARSKDVITWHLDCSFDVTQSFRVQLQ